MKIKCPKLIVLFPLFLFSGCVPSSHLHRSYFQEQPLGKQSVLVQTSDAGAIYLLDKVTRIVRSDSSSELIVHQIIKINRESGKKFAEVQIPYNQTFQKVKIDFARTITREGKIIKLKRNAIHTVTPASLAPYAALYSSLKVKTVSMPAVELGSIIEYQYRILQKKSLMKNHFWDDFYFQSEEPLVVSKYILVLPKSRTFKKLEKEINSPEITEKGGQRSYSWEKRDSAGLIREPEMPPLKQVLPLLLISSVKDWEEVASWYYTLAKEQMVADEPLKQEVFRLIKGKKTEREKIRAIYNYCSSNIRYVGLEIGINGYQPHQASEVFHLKYGDCKDKATLLITMLGVAGIRSYPVLINSEHQIDASLPSPSQFNHCIVAVPDEEKYLYLDTTAEICSFGDLPAEDQNRDVLIVKEGKAILVKTPLYRAQDNLCTRKIEINLKEDGTISAKVGVTTSGFFNLAYRSSFRYLRTIEQKKFLSEDLNRVCPGAVLAEFKISDLTNLDQPVEENYSFSVENYAMRMGNKLLIKPALIEAVRSTALVAEEKRNYPILFQRCWEKFENVLINLPDGWEAETLPEALLLRHPFGEFEASYQKTEEGILYQRKFRISQPEISILDYQEFKNFYKKIAYQDRKEIILTKTPK